MHMNLEQFQALLSFIAIGIGPLNYDEAYVENDPADPRLKGDLKFVAEQMGLICPPLHVSHPDEKRIINNYLKAHPNPRKSAKIELAKVFKACTNCATIFPKLPSMLTQYFKQWKESQLIKIAGE